MKTKIAPSCFNPKCLKEETRCDQCREHVESPFLSEKEFQVSLRPLDPEKVVPPYMPVEEGYGFLGTMLYSEVEDKVQCHKCGDLFPDVGTHARLKHKISPRSYKNKYSLNVGATLCIPSITEKRSVRGEFIYKLTHETLTSEEVSAIARERSRLSIASRKKMKYKQAWTVQMMNKYGTCPKQVEERFTRIVEENEGKAPSWDELYAKDSALLATLSRQFKGYVNALIYFGFKPKKKLPIRSVKQNKQQKLNTYGFETVKFLIEKFVDKHQRLPNPKDTKIGLLPDYDTIRRYFDGDWYRMKEFAWRRLALKYPEKANDYDEKFRRVRYTIKKDLSE